MFGQHQFSLLVASYESGPFIEGQSANRSQLRLSRLFPLLTLFLLTNLYTLQLLVEIKPFLILQPLHQPYQRLVPLPSIRQRHNNRREWPATMQEEGIRLEVSSDALGDLIGDFSQTHN